MPIHDWTCVDAGIFHAFHHDWVAQIARALNRGILPAAYYALREQIARAGGTDRGELLVELRRLERQQNVLRAELQALDEIAR